MERSLLLAVHRARRVYEAASKKQKPALEEPPSTIASCFRNLPRAFSRRKPGALFSEEKREEAYRLIEDAYRFCPEDYEVSVNYAPALRYKPCQPRIQDPAWHQAPAGIVVALNRQAQGTL